MLTYSELADRPEHFRVLTGMDVQEFDRLFGKVEEQYKDTEAARLFRREAGEADRGGEGRSSSP